MNPMAVGAERPRWALELATTAAATIALLVLALRLWRHDLSVPFNYWGDTLHFTALVHGLMLNGWPHHIPQLGAPFGFEAVAFPSLMTTDWALTWLIARFVDSPGSAINLFWLLSMLLTALSAMVAFRLLGAHRWIAIAAAVLYAVLPGAFMRNTGHISLVYYTVPLLSAFCISLLNKQQNSSESRILFALACAAAVLQGFNYIYYSFFAAGLLVLCLLWAAVCQRERAVFKRAGLVLVLLVFCSGVNLLPAVASWQREGRPPDMDYKFAAEAEINALKLRKLLLPHESNVLIGSWARLDRDARFPNENENEAVRLGPFGAFALVLSFCLMFAMAIGRAVEAGPNTRGSAALLLVTFLVTTVGGLGTLFNVLVSPDIRAYNRFSVFLAFFAFVLLSLVVTEALDRWGNRRLRKVLLGSMAALIAFSAYDQSLDARALVARYSLDRAAAANEQAAVRSLEAALSPGSTVFQYPITTFPPDGWRHEMGPYDHARPFLWSSDLRWSWPTFSGRKLLWEEDLQSRPLAEWATRLTLSGFDAVWIDRNGLADKGSAIESALIDAGALRIPALGTQRYGMLDLRPVLDRLNKDLGSDGLRQAMIEALPSLSVEYRTGFYPAERAPGGRLFRWMTREANIRLRNHLDSPSDAVLTLVLQAGGPGDVLIERDGQQVGRVRASAAGEESSLSVAFSPHEVVDLRLVSQHPALNAPNDPRALYTTLLSLHLRPSTPALQAPAK